MMLDGLGDLVTPSSSSSSTNGAASHTSHNGVILMVQISETTSPRRLFDSCHIAACKLIWTFESISKRFIINTDEKTMMLIMAKNENETSITANTRWDNVQYRTYQRIHFCLTSVSLFTCEMPLAKSFACLASVIWIH